MELGTEGGNTRVVAKRANSRARERGVSAVSGILVVILSEVEIAVCEAAHTLGV